MEMITDAAGRAAFLAKYVTRSGYKCGLLFLWLK